MIYYGRRLAFPVLYRSVTTDVRKGLTNMFYFHKDPRTMKLYHQKRGCHLVPVSVSSDPNWIMSNRAPDDREECPHCGGQRDRVAREAAAKIPR
jgi:hypothetical protein